MASGGAVSDHRDAEEASILGREGTASTRRGVGGQARTAAACALLALACAAPDEAPGPAPTLIRLSEQLAQAQVSSALDDVTPVTSIEALEGEVERRSVLATNFEGGPLPLVKPCGLAAGAVGPSGRGRVVRCEGGGALVLPAEPNRLYVLRASMRATGGERCRSQEVELIERRDGEPITLRPFARVGTDDWSTHEQVYLTRPETRRIDLSFRRGPCRGYVGEIALSELRLTPEQELAWIAGRSAAAGEDPHRRRGRLLPLPDPETAAPPFDDAYTVRDALFAPAPSEIVFPLRVPARARLHVHYGLARESRVGDAVELTIRVDASGEERELFRETLALEDEQDWHWRQASLDLTALADQSVELRFSARPVAGRGYALWGAPRIVAERAPGDPPNVVLIAIDTLRADRLSAYGYAKPTSPRIDAFATRAIRFDRAISAANWTSPAFHALFSGIGASEVRSRIPENERTLAEHFRDAGFVTQGFAYKAVLYDQGFDQGFDGYFNVPRVHVRAEDAVDHALRWLERHQRERFFLFLHLNDPHQPFTQPESHLAAADLERLRAQGLSLPITVKSDRIEGCARCASEGRVNAASRELAHALYDDAVRYADDALGVFLDRLREQALFDDAVIAIVADHGEGLWQHEEHFGHAGTSLYDEVVRVPLLLKPPAASAAQRGSVVSRQVRLADLHPTLLALAGVPVPRPADPGAARNLLDPPTDDDDRPALVRGDGSIALRTSAWKYVRRLPKRERLVREQLFDLAADPGERFDVASSRPEVLRRLRGELARALLASQSRHSLWLSGAASGQRAELVLRIANGRPVPELGSLPFAIEDEDGGRTLRWSGDAARALPVLVQIEPAPDAHYEIELRLDGNLALARSFDAADARPFTPSEAAAPAGTDLEARLFGHPSASREDTGSDAIDARNLEALRALGYLEP